MRACTGSSSGTVRKNCMEFSSSARSGTNRRHSCSTVASSSSNRYPSHHNLRLERIFSFPFEGGEDGNGVANPFTSKGELSRMIRFKSDIVVVCTSCAPSSSRPLVLVRAAPFWDGECEGNPPDPPIGVVREAMIVMSRIRDVESEGSLLLGELIEADVFKI